MILIPQLRHTPVRDPHTHDVADALSDRGEPRFRTLLTDPVALAVTVPMGVMSAGYYATLTWVPSILQDAGVDAHTAGRMLSCSAFPGILASLLVPALAKLLRPTWLLIAVSVALTAAAHIGLAVVPISAPYVWMTLLGLGQGAAMSLSLSYIVWRAPDAVHTGHLSTLAQGFGYLLAAVGPIGLGALRTFTGTWTIPHLPGETCRAPSCASLAGSSRTGSRIGSSPPPKRTRAWSDAPSSSARRTPTIPTTSRSSRTGYEGSPS